MQMAMFIDYDNLLEPQKQTGVLNVTTRALLAQPLKTAAASGGCEVRIYGGWYEGPMLTPLAQQLTAEIQGTFPTIIRCPTNTGTICKLSTQAELAFALSEDPSHHLLDTFRKKKAPCNLRSVPPLNGWLPESGMSSGTAA